MPRFDFDTLYDRRGSASGKWADCPEGGIALTTADMELQTPQVILDAMEVRLRHHVFGYEPTSSAALPLLPEFYRRRFGAEAEQDWFVFVLSVMPGLFRACALAGGDIMYCTPMYPYIRRTAEILGCHRVEVPMARTAEGGWRFDFDAMERALTPSVRCFILCSPHNPIGRVYTREELLAVIDFCEAHDLLLVSDEIHSEFALDRQHTPLFSLVAGRRVRSVTLASPGKTCNIPKNQFGFAVIPDAALRAQYTAFPYALMADGSIMDAAAFRAAYSPACDAWKDALLAHLRGNRDYLERRCAAMPGVSVTHAEGTFLAWLDLSVLGTDEPAALLREKCGVCLGAGLDFGPDSARFARLNYACPRSMLVDALDRIERLLK